MNKINIRLHGLSQSIERPITVQVVNDIKKLLNLPNEAYTTFSEEDKIIRVKNSLGKLVGQLQQSTDELIIAIYKEIPTPGLELSMNIYNPDQYEIYKDNDIGSKATAVVHRKDVEINFTYVTKSLSGINSVINTLRNSTSIDGMYMTHDLEYSYSIPIILQKLLININDLKNKRYPDDKKLDIKDYYNLTFDSRLCSNLTDDEDLSKATPVIKETQLDVLGYIKDDIYNIEYETLEGSKYSIAFTYAFSYEKPVLLNTEYPLLVFNSLISKEFRSFIKEEGINIDNRKRRTKGAIDLYDITEIPAKLRFDSGRYYLNLPKNDIFILPPPNPYTVRILSALIKIDENNPRFICNIKDIYGIKFKDSFLEYLLTYEREFINKLYSSLFYLELYIGERKANIKLILDELGNLYTEIDMSVFNIYRLVFNMVSDTDFLISDAKTRLKNYLEEEASKIEKLIELRTLTSDYNEALLYKTKILEESFLNRYIDFLNIDKTKLDKSFYDRDYEDGIFILKEPHWTRYYTCETLVVIPGLMEEVK